MIRIAIIGGGPGGLFTAYQLDEFHNDIASIKLFEASSRLGGKVLTRQFEKAPILYEAGVAELYDYSSIGPDPLRGLVTEFGLETVRMNGRAVIMDDMILRTEADFGRCYGPAALDELLSFYSDCAGQLSPRDFYEGIWADDNSHPLATISYAQMLNKIGNPTVRKYVEIAARSDVATEPHLTNGLDGLKNILMDHPRYMHLYSIIGGIQRLTDELEQRISADTVLDAELRRVEVGKDGALSLIFRRGGKTEVEDFDIVVIALPSPWLQRIEWGPPLRVALEKHLARYDRHTHYLRVSILFDRPFWRLKIPGSYFMSEAFNGCCIYDEGRRHASKQYGVLNWLIAGNDALMLSNYEDSRLAGMALDSLPNILAEGRALAVETHVHRWTGAISCLPGGNPVLPLRERHCPDPQNHSGLYIVGDYLFDSTLNGVFDSADYVSDLILTRLRKLKYLGDEYLPGMATVSGTLQQSYHDLYDGSRSYEDSIDEYFDEYYVRDLIAAIWRWRTPYTLLDCGSANGITLQRFSDIGIEAWGIENSAYVHASTPRKWLSRNLLGDIRQIPFPDNHFDFIYETCLCYLMPDEVEIAIREMLRVCRIGVFLGSITSDMTAEVIEDHDLFEGVSTLTTLWDWSEKFIRCGWRIAAADPKILARAWKIEVVANEGGPPWYPNVETMRYCFYTKPGAPEQATRSRGKRVKQG
jgi:protoporphyrinogen oxidase/SAM-dependent methyltransferase